MTDKCHNRLQNAMVLAAGLGTRIMSFSRELPKPLIQVGAKTLLDYTLDELGSGGITRAIVNVHYRADQIEAHLGTRTHPAITISDEREELLETGGGVKKALPLLGDQPFICTNTDAIFTGPPGAATTRLTDGWGDHMLALLLLVPLTRSFGFDGNGDFHLRPDNKITKAGDEAAEYAFTGLQILHPSLLDDAPEGRFSTRVLWQKAKQADALYGCIYPDQWLHVGTPEGVRQAEQHLNRKACG